MQAEDKTFLSKLVELYNLVYINDAILLIDNNDNIIFAGNKIQEIINREPYELLNRNHLQVLPLPAENLDNIAASVVKVRLSSLTEEFLSINLNHSSEYLILSCILKPIINPTTNSVVAISVESKKVTASLYLYKLLFFLENKPSKLIQQVEHSDTLLTLREHEIAFLLFYCKSTKKIAYILSNFHDKSITAKTIGNNTRAWSIYRWNNCELF